MHTSSPSDHTLASLVATHGDKQAFSQLVRRHQSAIRRFFLNLTG